MTSNAIFLKFSVKFAFEKLDQKLLLLCYCIYLKPYLEVQLGRESHRSPIDWRDRTIRLRSQDLSKAFSWDYPLSYSFDGFYMKLLAHTFLEYFLLQFMNTKVKFK